MSEDTMLILIFVATVVLNVCTVVIRLELIEKLKAWNRRRRNRRHA